MILKSYLVEKDIKVLKNYKANLIYGENNGIKDDVKEKIIEQNKDSEIIFFFESDVLKSNLLFENIANQSLFNEKKIIFIEEVTEKIFIQMSECLEKNIQNTQIYLFANNLEKKSKLRNLFEKDKKLSIFSCYKDNERTLIAYVNKKLNSIKGLTGEITNLIINNSNMDRRTIKSEIVKIKDFFIDKKIDKNQILEILNIKSNSDFDEIRDNSLLGKKEKINKLLSETEILYDEAFYYLNVLNHRIARLYEISKMNRNQEDFELILENLKPPIFWKDKPVMLRQLSIWSHTKLKEIIIELEKAETLMKKNSYLKNDIIIKKLIIDLTNKASISY